MCVHEGLRKISAGSRLSERGRNRSALALRPFTYSEYEIFKNRDYYNINGAGIKRSFYSIGEDIDRFLAASRVIEYLNETLEEGKRQPRTFELTIEFMEAITQAKGNYETMLYAYLVKKSWNAGGYAGAESVRGLRKEARGI